MSPAMRRAYAGSRCRRGREHLRQHPGVRRHHQRARRRGGEHQPAAAPPVLDGEVLRQPAAPGEAEHVDRLVEAQPGEHAGDDRAEGRPGCRARPAAASRRTPGTSKRITLRRGSRASTKGCSTSRLAPMPFISSSGGRRAVPGRTETRSVRPADGDRADSRRAPPGAGLTCRTRRCRAPRASSRPSAAELGGAAISSPDRSPSQVVKSGHQEPCSVSRRRQPLLGVRRRCRPATWKVDFGLPGGLTSEAMWPLVDSTKRVSPPSSWVLR